MASCHFNSSDIPAFPPDGHRRVMCSLAAADGISIRDPAIEYAVLVLNVANIGPGLQILTGDDADAVRTGRNTRAQLNVLVQLEHLAFYAIVRDRVSGEPVDCMDGGLMSRPE